MFADILCYVQDIFLSGIPIIFTCVFQCHSISRNVEIWGWGLVAVLALHRFSLGLRFVECVFGGSSTMLFCDAALLNQMGHSIPHLTAGSH